MIKSRTIKCSGPIIGLLLCPLLMSGSIRSYKTEVFIGNDNGIGVTGTIYDSVEGTNDIVIPTTDLTHGAHLLSVRVTDDEGHWTPTVSHLIYVCEPVGVNGAEYFIDDDPGAGKGIQIPGAHAGTFSFSVATGALSVGLHTLTVRTLGSSGMWDGGMSRTFLVTANSVEIEWFYDRDPGYGNGNRVAAESSENIIMLPTATLPPGVHLLSVRARDTKDRWSATVTHPLYVTESVEDMTGGEYFVDNDPGEGCATGFVLDEAGNGSFAVPTTGLASGIHYLTLRGLTAGGKWLPLHVAPFEVKLMSGICEVEWKMTFNARRESDILTLESTNIASGSKVEIVNVGGLCLHAGTWSDTSSAYTVNLDESQRNVIVVITSPDGLRTVKRIH